ncbi:hypothetical protein F4775DRAFT_387646 [Biscogniauxia sp. FL1348]|nr:hypothetical protein F4775DRAFT_387646 [Biscogniauxia sp. FL1348]
MIDHAGIRDIAVLFLLGASPFFGTVTAAKSCYKNNGQLWELNSSSPVAPWVPCDSNAEVSACCSQDDYCLSNGLCMIQNGGDGNRFIISQEGCTDPNWSAPCNNFCTNKSDDPNGYMFPWQCSDLSWCCGTKDETCCDTSDYFFPIAEITGIQPPVARYTASTSASGSLSTISGSVSTGQSAASATAADCPATSSEDSTQRLAIGLGVGLPLGLALIAAISFLGFQVRKRAAAETALASAGKASGAAALLPPDGSNYASSSTNYANPAPDQYQSHDWYAQDESQRSMYQNPAMHHPPINKGDPRELSNEPIMRELES